MIGTWGRSFAGAAILAALAACAETPSSPYAPGTRAGGTSVDGLIVGHRLMAAGQHELALEAYLRAGVEQGLTADTLSAIGSANLALGRLGQAENILRKAIVEDETFVPAWNNLGVVLMETGQVAEASRVFQTAYALDSGESDAIRDNLRLSLAKLEEPTYDEPDESEFVLVRRGNGQYLLLSTP